MNCLIDLKNLSEHEAQTLMYVENHVKTYTRKAVSSQFFKHSDKN
jgi:hypothetical protein